MAANTTDQSNQTELEQLRAMTVIVADTGDFQAVKKHSPKDATTNPSLVYKALKAMKTDDAKNNSEYESLLTLAVNYANSECDSNTPLSDKLNMAIDRLAVEFGKKILSVIPGYVSTELDARLSFDIENSVARAVNIISMYEKLGVTNARDRVLIKVAATWEGVQIAKILSEKHHIKCNMTLLFSIYQAAAAAQIANAYLISPFVGRITDWHKSKENINSYDAYTNDPGVQSVRDIYGYYKRIKSKTIIMGASFRNKDQVLALAGCDRLTIGPKWLVALNNSKNKIKKYLIDNGDKTETIYVNKINITESTFRYGMCLDPCATEKLAEGIRKFAADIVNVENLLRPKFNT